MLKSSEKIFLRDGLISLITARFITVFWAVTQEF